MSIPIEHEKNKIFLNSIPKAINFNIEKTNIKNPFFDDYQYKINKTYDAFTQSQSTIKMKNILFALNLTNECELILDEDEYNKLCDVYDTCILLK
jgi:hypothetical protein